MSQADRLPDSLGLERTKLYSPNQVAASAFFGGPIAAIYVLWRNFRTVGNDNAARQTVWIGAGLFILLLAVLPFLPESFPNSALPAGYTVAAFTIARTYQMSKEAISASEHHAFQSNWKVAGLALAFLVATGVIIFVEFLALDQLGIISL
jgi:hypothetical protein